MALHAHGTPTQEAVRRKLKKNRVRASDIRDQERASAIFKALDRAGLDAGETSGIPLRIIIRNALEIERQRRSGKVRGK